MSESDDGGPTGRTAITADGIATYVRCPRRYEFAHETGLADGGEAALADRRLALLRTAICDALRYAGPSTVGAAARDRLGDLWDEADERGRYHSIEQARHERRALEATLSAYGESLGDSHARGIERVRRAAASDPADEGPALVGPELALESAVRVSDAGDDRPVRVAASVDYVFEAGPEGPVGTDESGDGPAGDAEGDLVAVRFLPTLDRLGLLRYRSAWDRGVDDLFDAHVDPDADRFEPDAVGVLLETAAVLEGLRAYRDRLGLSADRRCRYVVVPLVDRSNAAVNWVRETVETSLEAVDLTEPFLDHRTFGMTFEHRNEAVEDHLERVVGEIAAGEFDPGDRWDDIAATVCDDCEYAVCCGEYVASEVRFDG